MKKIVILLGVATCFTTTLAAPTATDTAAETKEKVNYIPSVHGVVRTRWEVETSTGDNRFQVRNARIAIGGKVAPTISYMVQADFCDQGKIKILDAWGSIGICRGLSLKAGQFLMPVGIEPLRAPADYIFANRSFLGKQVCNARAVGVEAAYLLPVAPVTLKAALFNPSTISDHTIWNRTFAYSGSVEWRLHEVTLSAGFQSTRPQVTRINITDAAVTWRHERWLVEGEYMHKHYTHDAYKGCHAYSAFADYRLPIKGGVFHRLSFQGRFDGMTDHSSATPDVAGRLTTDDPARNRITVGSTLSHIQRVIHADVRLNYEKYFYRHSIDAPRGSGDKVVAELVVKF